MTSIAEKYAQQCQPNGEASLAALIQAALAEQAEAFKGELRAYDGMVRELTKTVEDMRAAQSVPVVGDVDCYEAGLLSDFGGGNVEWWQDYIRAELARAHEFYVSQWPSAIPATELATLREKAVLLEEAHEIIEQYKGMAARYKSCMDERDELRKDAERLQFMLDETAILMYSVGIDRTLCRVEWPLTGYVQDAFYPSERAAIDAAIAQGKGE